MKNKEEKIIPKKNYYILILISILVIILTLYIRSFYFNYIDSKKENSILNDKNISQINTDDVDYAIAEINEAILYIGYSNSKIHSMEKRLFKEIESKDLSDKFIYWNISELIDNGGYISILRNKFPNIKDNINKAPMFIYIKDGEGVDVIDSTNKLIDYKVLNTLLNKYAIE